MKRLSALGLATFGLVALLAGSAAAQGVLIIVDPPHPIPLPRPIIIPRPRPEPESVYKIKELLVQARVVDQAARVNVSQTFVNTGSRQMEVQFVFPLPYDGAVDSLTLLVDGKEYPAQLLDKDKAREIYEGFVRRNQDPALLEWVGNGMFQTSIFPVPAGAERTVTLRYNQLLRKEDRLTDFLFPLGTAKYTSKPVEKVKIDVSIESSEEIRSVYSPTHTSLTITRPDKKLAKVVYEAENTVPTSDFRLFYDTAAGELGMSLLSYRPDTDEDGYLLLLASPEIKAADAKRQAKTVVFVVDRSGSMSGKKIEQAREALRFVLGNLREGDLFNIIAYDSSVESFRPELERFNEETHKAALGFVQGIYAGGATNINDALVTALSMIQDTKQPNYVLFLTDGLPTTGVTNELQIVQNAEAANKANVRVLNLGVGYDVNARLLDRLSRSLNGRSEYVRPNEDIETHVGRIYKRIGSPVMTDVKLEFEFDEVKPEEGQIVNRMMPAKLTDLFEGEQLVVAARYRKPGAVKVILTGKVGGKEQKFTFNQELVEKSATESYAFVEKLWAMRRIGEIIDELDLKGKNDELVQELVALSTKHGILTPYTSFLADDTGTIKDLADARRADPGSVVLDRARRGLEALGRVEGRAGVAQRAEKLALQEAAAAPAADGFGGFAGGSGGQPGGPVFRDIEADEVVQVEAVRQVGNQTLYRRNNVWVAANAADADLAKEENVQTIARFSDEYFKLVRANTPAENLLLAQQQPGEELILRLRGQLYRIR